MTNINMPINQFFVNILIWINSMSLLELIIFILAIVFIFTLITFLLYKSLNKYEKE